MAQDNETVHQHLHNVHEHLKHDSTSNTPDEIRERLRREELASQREEKANDDQTAKTTTNHSVGVA